MINKIVTIGVYGFTPTSFFAALQEAGVDLLVDIRWRRGVRGSEYSFANSNRLQRRLSELGINYVHRRDLAPTPAVRKLQQILDKESGQAKRLRTELGQSFTDAFLHEVLAPADAAGVLQELTQSGNDIALLCVERTPEACHRSLVASWLANVENIPMEHLLP